MNFAGPFVSEPSHVSPVSLGGDGFTFKKPGFIQHNPSDSHVVIPDAHLLFSGDYTRIGNDLIISGDGQKLVVGNYFKGETRPALTSKDGATLAGHVVDALTGHVHYAQANAAAPAAGQVIGNVQKLSGSATVIRNGVSTELHIGDAIQKGDVIQTGSDSSIGMTFVDGSAFGMTSNARMVMNEMIYDPNGSSNSSLISLVQGTITFVAGQTAKNGNMRVETPVATMGIRGTAVLVEIGANDGPTKFSVLVEPDGHTGSYNLYDKATGQLIGTVSQAGQVTFVTSLGLGQPPSAIEQLKTLADQQAEKAIIQQVFQLYFPNYNPDDSNPKSPKFGHNTSGNNLAEIIFTTNSNAQQTFLTQIELRFAVTDPITGITTYQNKIFYNTKAQFSASSILSEQAFNSTVESFKISDLVHIDDPDIGNAPFYDTATPFVAGSAIIKSAVSTNPNLSADFLSQFLHIDQTTGVITFDRLGFNFLGEGESVTFMIQVTSRSGPDVAHVIIPVTITGDNDVPNDNGAPTIVLSLSDIVGAVKEDTPVGVTTLADSGTITFRDVDLTDTHTVAKAFTSSASDLPGFTTGTHIGTFTINLDPENTTDTVNTGTVGWHFSLPDNDPTLQSLAEGQTITQVYTITVTDIHGALVTQTVTITITGTNDAPVIAAIAATSLDEQTDTSALTLASPIHVTFGDADLSDVGHTALITAVTTAGVTAGLSLTPAQLIALVTPITTAKADGSSAGSVDLGFSAPSTAFDYLAAGEAITLTYTVTVSDGDGGTTPATFDVTITGTNDAPVIAADTSGTQGTNVHDITETDGGLTTSGTLAVTDVDVTNTVTASVFDVAIGGTGSTYLPHGLDSATLKTMLSVDTGNVIGNADTTGTIHWTFDSGQQAFDFLAAGETLVLTYTIRATDSDSTQATGDQTVVVTITGTNDAPTVDAALTLATSEGDAPVVRDLLEGASDVDASDTLSVTNIQYSVDGGLQTPATPGGITILQDGHTINVDGANPAFDHLAAGATQEIVVSYDVTDTHGATTAQTETITITGLNDRPVLALGANLTTITEDQTANPGQSVGSFATGISDADDGALKGVAITGYTNQNGHWEYSVDGGSSWTAFGTYSASSGLLLASDDKVRFVPNGENGGTDTLTYVAWDQTSGAHGQTANTALAEHWAAFSQDSQTASLTVTSVNDAPHIDTSNVQITDSGGSVVISGAMIVDPDTADGFMTNLLPDSGTVSGTLDSMTYTPPGTPPEVGQIKTTVTDIAGASDTVNFIFNVSGTGSVTMQGTSDKDVSFATSHQDTFVFAPGSNQDVIANGFQSGIDKIDLQAFSAIDATALTGLLADADHIGSDTLLHLNGNTDTVLLKGVAALSASDFILHA